jgi:hypothetical protein
LPGRLNVTAKAAFCGNVLYVAHGQPHVAGADAGSQCFVGGPAPDAREAQRAAEYPGIACTELIVHEPPKITDPHNIESLMADGL